MGYLPGAFRPGAHMSTGPGGSIRPTGTVGQATPIRSITHGLSPGASAPTTTRSEACTARYGYTYGPYRGMAGVLSVEPTHRLLCARWGSLGPYARFGRFCRSLQSAHGRSRIPCRWAQCLRGLEVGWNHAQFRLGAAVPGPVRCGRWLVAPLEPIRRSRLHP